MPTTTAFRTLDEAFAAIETFTNFEKKPFNLREIRLERMHELLALFDNPETAFKSLHVAGSKGKGSTSVFLASILRAAGFKTGLYASPHLVSYKERISLAGDEFQDDIMLEQANLIFERLCGIGPQRFTGGLMPTTFELLTLLGFLVFRASGCEWAVLETGMGGRLDATNVVRPEASIITPIELEHTEHLGDSLDKIAGEKAGIIKPGRPVFSSAQHPAVMEVLLRRSAEQGTMVRFLPEELVGLSDEIRIDGMELRLRLRNGRKADCRLRLGGVFQAENAALASLCLTSLMPELPDETLEQGLARAFIPGRFHLLSKDPPIIVDGSHTPNSVTRLIESFKHIFSRRGVLVLGIVSGKKYAEITEVLRPHFKAIIVTTPGTFKASNPRELYDHCSSVHPHVELEPHPAQALRRALELRRDDEPVLVTGSFYLAGEIMRFYVP